MKRSLSTILNHFFNQYLVVECGRSANSLAAFRDCFKLLFKYVAGVLEKDVDELEIEDIDQAQVLAFLEHAEKERGWKASTRNQRLSLIKSLFRYIAREHPDLILQAQGIRAIANKKTLHHTPDYLEEEEVQAFLDAVDLSTPLGVRDYAILLLFYNVGARVSELTQLDIDDLRLDGNGQVQLLGKGGKRRTCPLWPETVQAIRKCIETREPKHQDEQKLFLNFRGEHITRFGVRYILKKYGATAAKACPSISTKTITPHVMRHTAAMHLVRAGNDIVTASYWLGHAHINTTHIYVEIDMKRKRQMLEKTEAPKTTASPSWRQPHIIELLDNITRKHYPLCEAGT